MRSSAQVRPRDQGTVTASTNAPPTHAHLAPGPLFVWLDHGAIGCGWRCLFLLSAGRRWARVLNLENGRVHRLPLADLSRATQMVPDNAMVRRLRARLRHLVAAAWSPLNRKKAAETGRILERAVSTSEMAA